MKPAPSRSAPGGSGGALVALAAGVGLLVALRSVAALELDGLHALLAVEPLPREGLGISWSGRARWPADAQLAAWGSLLRTIAALFVASVGVATLNAVVLLAEASASRRTEMAVRAALGATPRMLALRLLAELRTLALAGLALGLVAGMGAGVAARAAWPGVLEPALAALPLETVVAALALLALVAAAHLSGARRAVRTGRLADDLRAGTRAGADPLAVFVRKVLAAGHVAVAGSVLAVAVTLSAAVAGGLGSGNGPGGDEPVVVEVTSPTSTPDGWTEALATARSAGLAAESLAAPGTLVGLGVRDIAITECGACSRGGLPAPLWSALADHHAVAPGWFALAGLDLVEGRAFTPADVAGAEPVAIVNRTFARSSFENGRPLGKRIRIGTDFASWYTVVGVVEDEPIPTLGADGARREAVYLSALQRRPRAATMLLRGHETAVGAAVEALEAAGFTPGDPETLSEHRRRLAGAIAWSRVTAMALAGLVLLLSMHGVWLVALQTTRRRWSDVAVRRAVGAPSAAVVRWVLAERLRVTAWGLAGLAFFGTLATAFVQAATGLPGPALVGWAAIAAALTVVALVASSRAVREALAVEPVHLLE